MGLLDKVKEQANVALEKAQQAGAAGQAKIDSIQAKRQVDQLLRQIGAAVYTAQAGGSEPDISGLIAQVTEIESEHPGTVAQSAAGGS